MQMQEYRLEELRFAYCYHIYLHWRTHRRRPYPLLARLDAAAFQQLLGPYDIHVLECASDAIDVRVLASLRPEEAVSACASKLKGRASKWLKQALDLEGPADLLGKGYFACTSGKSTREQVEAYLDQQEDHHGYTERVLPPVYVQTYDLPAEAEARLQAQHASSMLQFHLVLATWRRRGVFGPEEARAVADRWRSLEAGRQFALRKVSFVPDHVHVAVRTHPSVAPATVVVLLMNAAQEIVWQRFAESAIGARLERLWQPSAYVGAYGDLASPQLQQYLRNWKASREP